jgi:uncharacterized protein YrzB (UPF0473 family)
MLLTKELRRAENAPQSTYFETQGGAASMSEEYGNDFVTLIDEDGNEVEFEHIDTVEYEGVTYLAFIPAELSVEEDAEVVIMQVVTDENGEELLEGVEDDDIADAVFNIVMERAEAEDEE